MKQAADVVAYLRESLGAHGAKADATSVALAGRECALADAANCRLDLARLRQIDVQSN